MNVSPGTRFSRHLANAASLPSAVSHWGGPSGAKGKPPVWSSTCSTVTTSLPFVPNSGR